MVSKPNPPACSSHNFMRFFSNYLKNKLILVQLYKFNLEIAYELNVFLFLCCMMLCINTLMYVLIFDYAFNLLLHVHPVGCIRE